MGWQRFGMIINLLTCFSHIYPGSSSYLSAWHFMLLYFPFFIISPHFSVLKLFGSPVLQRHVPVDVSLTQAMLSLNHLHDWDPLTLSKPMNQRIFVCSLFLVKLWTKCHSDSVSIETSELFSSSLHFSLAVLQSNVSSWKEYLEQTVTDVEKGDKQEKLSIYLSFNCIYHSRVRRSYTEGELNKTLGHTKVFTSAMVQ